MYSDLIGHFTDYMTDPSRMSAADVKVIMSGNVEKKPWPS